MRIYLRRTVQAGLGGLVVAGAVAFLAAPAAAHVTVAASSTAAGSFTVLTFSVPHGCDGSPTTKVAIKIADGINAVTPTVNTGWSVEKVMVDLNPPVTDSHGNEITKRVDQVVYTAKAPLPADMRDTLALSLQLPDKAGETLAFPIVQSCVQGETAWAQMPAEGAAEPEHPAPVVKLTEAAGEHGGAAEQPEAAPVASSSEDTGIGNGAVSWIALVLGALGLVAAGLALLRTRRTT